MLDNREVITRLRTAGLVPGDVEGLIHPEFGEICDALTSRNLTFETLGHVIRVTKDIDWLNDYDSYWSMILDHILDNYDT